MSTTKIVSSLAAVLLCAGFLAGCSAVSSVANLQTKVQACAKIKVSFTTLGKTLTADAPLLATDPSGASTKISAAAAAFAKDSHSLSNKQVRTAADGAATQFTKFAKDVASLAATPSTDAAQLIQSDVTPLKTAVAKVTAACKF